MYSGEYEGEEEPRLQTLRTAIELGAPYVDIELAAVEAFKQAGGPLPHGTQLIVSLHNFETTLSAEELRGKEQQMRDHGAHIAKLAMTAQDVTDSWTMLELLEQRSGATCACASSFAGTQFTRASAAAAAAAMHEG